MKKINFKNLPDTTTPLSAENLNTLQNNIEESVGKTIYEGTLSGSESVKIDNAKRFIEIYAALGTKGITKYTIDTKKTNGETFSSGIIMAFDSPSGLEYYLSEAKYNNGTLTHTRTGFFNISSGSYTSRNKGDSPYFAGYNIYRIETHD